MHYGIEVVPFGEFGDPRVAVRLAQAAEAAGWEAFWVWDHALFPYGVGDPWVILSAVAQATRRIKLIVGVAPLPRYRPYLLARLTASLDILSGGRLILGAGIGGVADEFTAFGEEGDPRLRAEKLDESLEVLTALWQGEPVTYHGRHYTVNGAQLVPRPVQQPRIPVWIGGDAPRALRRAARWDGWIIGIVDENCQATKTPEKFAEQVAYIRQHRTTNGPFEITLDGTTRPGQIEAFIAPYAGTGPTWYFEAVFGLRGSLKDMLKRIQVGPA